MATILIVDDETSIRSSVKRFLQSKEHDVLEAGDGIEALDALAAHRIDVAIVDLVMPRMNGLELISRMSSEYAETKILVMSAYPDVCELSDSQGDVVGVLRKPFELRHLAEALGLALSER